MPLSLMSLQMWAIARCVTWCGPWLFNTVRLLDVFTMMKYRIHNRLMQPLRLENMVNIAATHARNETDPKVAIMVLTIYARMV